MTIIKTKPTTNARRKMSFQVFDIEKKSPEKSLTFGIKRGVGRGSDGRILTAHKGGGAKRRYRIVDFSMTGFLGKKGIVKAIEYDPNRTANIALISYEDGSKIYMIAPENLKKAQTIICDENAPIRLGNRMQLKNIPPATQIYNIELTTGKGGQICRSAGTFATMLGLDGDFALIRLTSGEVRKIRSQNFASLGVVSNVDHSKVVYGKAGRVRHLGVKPTVLGKSKNPVDHPHGGGEGHSPIGMKYPKTPWGAPALGRRTRNKKKSSSGLIISRRKK
ncbi:MAG: 50S ribosomal protein L2 [Patescibacteria group bacterium]